MSKFATKAAANMFCQARYEAAKSNERLSSREGAAEEIGIDRTRLARIELGSTIPYQEEVLLMADCYKAPELKGNYCREMCPLGKNILNKANLIGSYLYEFDKHGCPIVGNILFIGEKMGDDGVEFCGICEENFSLLETELKNIITAFSWMLLWIACLKKPVRETVRRGSEVQRMQEAVP